MARKKEAKKEAGKPVKPRRRRGTGLWSYPMIALGVSLVGVALTAGLIYLQLLGPANVLHAERLNKSHAQMFATYFDARLLALRTGIERIATSNETVAAFKSFDSDRIEAHGKRLTKEFADAERIELIPTGDEKVDLSARIPISFAALDVIKRAQTTPYVGPEAYLLDQQSVFYVAAPVMDEGSVIGVLFAAISMNYFAKPLSAFDPGLGLVQLEQRFESTEPRVVLTYGKPVTRAKNILLPLNTPRWSLVFSPNPAVASPLVHAYELAAPFGLLIAVLLGAIYLSNVRLFGAISSDANTLTGYVTQLLRGRSGAIERYRLEVFQHIANEAGKYARQSAPPANARAPRAGRPTAKRAAAAAKSGPAATAARDDGNKATAEEAEDFLEVDDSSEQEATPEKEEDFDDNFGIEVSEDVSPEEMGLKIDPQIFRAYDIRGIVDANLSEDMVYWIGRAFGAEAREAQQPKIVVGGDGRSSTERLKDALIRGLTESGVDVVDVGRVPTPLLYFANFALNTGTGIMVTGSHNPPEYNGLKMVLAGETLAEERIQGLKERIELNRFTIGEGKVEQADIIDAYLDRVINDVAVAQPLKVVVDCGNGVAGDVAPRLVQELGCEVVPLYCDVDGSFPNHHPDPADPANLEDLITVVKDEGADLGLAFDGDGDRLGVVTATGQIIWPDKLMMLFSRDIVGRNPGADIIFDVKCSRHLNSVISDYGGRPIMWKTGHSHIKAKLKETGALLGGEFSGHICFGERWYGFDDALYSAARLLEIIGGEAQDADALFAEFPVVFSTPEIKVQTTESAKFEIVKKLAGLAATGSFEGGTVTSIDGVRVDYPDGWGLVRPSNTSPVLTLRFEADDQTALERIKARLIAALKEVDPSLEIAA